MAGLRANHPGLRPREFGTLPVSLALVFILNLAALFATEQSSCPGVPGLESRLRLHFVLP